MSDPGASALVLASSGARPFAARLWERPLGWGCLALALASAPALPARELWHTDELRYVEVARQASAFGHWVLPHLNGEVYAEKPPLAFWAIAALHRLLGDWDLAGRSLSFLATLATVGAVVALGRLLFTDARVAALGALVFATSATVADRAQEALIDPLLAAFTTWAVVALLRGATASGGVRLAWSAAAALATAGAALAKGPPGLLAVALGALAVGAVWRGRRGVALAPLAAALLMAAAVTIGWLALAARQAGPGFFERMLLGQTAGRLAGEAAPHAEPAWFYLVDMPGRLLPWVVLLPGALVVVWRGVGATPSLGGCRSGVSLRAGARARDSRERSGRPQARWRARGRARAGGHAHGDGHGHGQGHEGQHQDPTPCPSPRSDERAALGLFAWGALALALFSLVSGKRSGYLLPYVPPFALLIAFAVTRARAEDRLDGALLARPLGLVPALAAACAAVAAVLAVLVPLAWAFELPPSRAAEFVARLPLATPLVLALAGLALLALAGAARRAADLPERAGALAAAAAVTIGAVHGVALSAADRDRAIRPFGEALVRAVPPGAPLLLLEELHDGRINLYTGAEHHDVVPGAELPARLAAPDRVWLVARERDWEALPREVRAALEISIDYPYSGGRRRFLLLRER